jgi:ribonuclease E
MGLERKGFRLSENKDEANSTVADAVADTGSASSQAEPARSTARRRRRRRGGRGRSSGSRHTTARAQEAAGAETDLPSLDDSPGALRAATRKAETPGRGTVPLDVEGEGEAGEAHEAAAPQDAPVTAEAAVSTSAARRRRRRRGGRGRSPRTVPGETRTEKAEKAEKAEPAQRAEPEAAEEPAAEAPVEPVPKEQPSTRTARSRRARTSGRGRRERDREVVIPRATDKTMLITEIGDRDQIAVLEGRELVEHYITRAGARSMVGNIYLGKVQNVLPGMEAAFVDVGRGRNAVLYAGEVSYDEEVDGETPRIEKVLRSGQNVLVQITKDPMGGKGARLTQEISLPGRFVVFVPSSGVFGISRRLPDRERGRLKDLLKKIRPEGHGLIVRTAAEGATMEELQGDVERLVKEWEGIAKDAKRGKAPRLLHEEPELTVRVVRDAFTGGEFKEMITDSVPLYDQVVAYLKGVAPELLPKLKMHEGALPLLEEFHVVEQIHKALDRKVWLPSGGYLVIDRTEALTVIDVNTGKHIGKANLEETVTKTNMEAVEEVSRQLRLRDIGGIIIIDFIDMLLEKNKGKVIQAMRNALARDKTRSQVFDIGPLGLLEITRKRVSAGLLESFSETCPTCEGRGLLVTYNA